MGPLYGGVALDNDNPANDARIGNWRQQAMRAPPLGFKGYARTRENGGGVLRLPDQLGARAFEAQQLVYRDLDGDPTVDEHEYAQPLFVEDG